MVVDVNGRRALADWDTHIFVTGFGCDAASDQDTGLAPNFEMLNAPLAGGKGKGGIGLCAIQRPDAFMVDQYLKRSRAFRSRASRLVIQGVKQMFAIIVELWCFHGAVLLDPLQREPTRLPFSADGYGD